MNLSATNCKWSTAGLGFFILLFMQASGTANAANNFPRVQKNDVLTQQGKYHVYVNADSDIKSKADFKAFANKKVCAKVNTAGVVLFKSHFDNPDLEVDFIYTSNWQESFLNLELWGTSLNGEGVKKCEAAILPHALVTQSGYTLEEMAIRDVGALPDKHRSIFEKNTSLTVTDVEPMDCSVLGGPTIDCEANSQVIEILTEADVDDSILGFPSQATCPHA